MVVGFAAGAWDIASGETGIDIEKVVISLTLPHVRKKSKKMRPFCVHWEKISGSVADLIGSGETVRETRYGRPVFLIIPEIRDTEEIMCRIAGKRLVEKLRNSTPTAAASALTQEVVNKMIDERFA